MISIAIATYEMKGHGAAMLTLLLNSIRSQKYYDQYEIVISDNALDGSIIDVCTKFPSLPINYHFNPVRGASENINHAVDLCKYDKVKIMCQDDFFTDPLALQKFSNILDVAGWAVTDSTHVNATGQKTGQRIAAYNPENFDSNTVGMPSVMAFRKCGVSFDTRLKTFCDLYFYYQLYQVYGPPAKVPGFNVAQRYHNASLSRNQPGSHKADKAFLIRNGLIPGSLPRVVVAVVVYNRYDNIERWLKCWNESETQGAKLVVIFNNENTGTPNLNGHSENVKFIDRPNIGYDIGAFQDVCRNRLPGFPDFDYLIWNTDDTIPMRKDFISPFIDSFDKTTGLTCMQISKEVTRHVRTTGFCVTKDVARRLSFPADPIKTVQDCWYFEHRGGQRTLLKQVERMGLKAIQVAPLEKSPLYDTGFWYRNEAAKKVAHLYDRMAEHNRIFEKIPTNV